MSYRPRNPFLLAPLSLAWILIVTVPGARASEVVAAASTANGALDVLPPINVTRELSVAPLDHIEYPGSRPAWVDQSPVLDGETFRAVVVSGPFDTPEDSLEALQLMLRDVVATMAAQIADSDGQIHFYEIRDEQIDRQLVSRRYAGEVVQGDRTRYEHAAEIIFSEDQQRQVREAWRRVEMTDRLAAVGFVTILGMTFMTGASAVTGWFSRRAIRRAGRGSAR